MPSIFDRLRSSLNGRRNSLHPTIVARKPQPATNDQPSLAALPDDLVLHIFEAVQDVRPGSLLILASVNSCYYHHARRVQHRHMSVNLDRQDSMTRLTFASQNGRLPAVRTLAVEGTGDPNTLDHLGDLIKGMTGLRDVEWAVPAISKPVLQSMQNFSQPRLHIAIIGMMREKAEKLLVDLADCTILSSLSVKFMYRSGSDCVDITQPLKRILLSCPNLRKLSLNLYPRAGGCLAFDPPAQYIGIGLSKGERPPPLEELRITDYPWGFQCDSPYGVNCIGYPGKGLEMEYWADVFDWSRLQRLDLAGIMFASKAMPYLTALKHVSLEYGQGPAEQQFFENIPSKLESICVSDLKCIGLDGIIRHGTWLQKLEIHTPDHRSGTHMEGAIPDQVLERLCKVLPQLCELGIHVVRDQNDWPYHTFDILAKFPKLQRLEIWFELGKASATPPAPFLTATSASQLFTYLHGRLPKLECLRVHSGCSVDLTADWDCLVEENHWPYQNSTAFVCRPAENDRDVARGLVDVECERLSKQLNRKLQRIARGEEPHNLPKDDNLAFRVALEGPLPVKEWLELRAQEWLKFQREYRRQHSRYAIDVRKLGRLWKG